MLIPVISWMYPLSPSARRGHTRPGCRKAVATGKTDKPNAPEQKAGRRSTGLCIKAGIHNNPYMLNNNELTEVITQKGFSEGVRGWSAAFAVFVLNSTQTLPAFPDSRRAGQSEQRVYSDRGNDRH
jgi:hypothetical protein